ncbi:MAG: FAD-dependent oxidoreductase [Oscillospiraceae bacterium]|nr:FAD-dependent oxidoreductase [Oscillospiraceae bacterium]
MKSIWSDSVILPRFPRLTGDLHVEVLIIGGGLTGILCAYMLEQAAVPYALVEAETIGSGITKNTTAKITSQHGLIYDKLMRKFGVEAASLYLRANEEALERIAGLCAGIPCDFERKDAFVYTMDAPEKIEKELKALQKLNYPAEFAKELPLPFCTAGAVKFPNQAQFNPLKFIGGLVKGLHIYEHTKVCELSEGRAVTTGGTVTATKMIMAAHFPFVNQHGSYFLKLYQHRSYVIALEKAPSVPGMYVDEAQKGMSFRSYDDMLLIGGGAHRTGKKGGNWRELEDFAKRYYPPAQERYRWAAQDCMSLDGVPYIGRYSKNTPDLFVATGYNKWGMTTAMAAAGILTDSITGKENPYAAVFSPSRSILTPQLAVNSFEAAINLLSFSKHRCPHMGCALKWNAAEHTWDCPCHGSRFDEKGGLIDNPSTDGIQMKD